MAKLTPAERYAKQVEINRIRGELARLRELAVDDKQYEKLKKQFLQSGKATTEKKYFSGSSNEKLNQAKPTPRANIVKDFAEVPNRPPKQKIPTPLRVNKNLPADQQYADLVRRIANQEQKRIAAELELPKQTRAKPVIDRRTKTAQKALLSEIDANYAKTITELQAKTAGIFDSNGKVQRARIKALSQTIKEAWAVNSRIILMKSAGMIRDTLLFYEYASFQAGNPLIMPSDKISSMVETTLERRRKIIKWDKVVKGNERILDRRVATIVKDGLANSKTPRQIQAELEKTLNMNRGKAKTIARTESNFYRTDSKLQVAREQQKIGNEVTKTWVYTHLSFEPRPAHLAADGQTVVGVDADFVVGGYTTYAPHHFGMASQDINCTCDFEMSYENGGETSEKQYEIYKEDRTSYVKDYNGRVYTEVDGIIQPYESVPIGAFQ